MKKLIAVGIVLLFLSTTIVLGSSQQSIDPITQQNETPTEPTEKAFTLPVFVSAFPKIFLAKKPVFIIVLFPKFLIDGYIEYDFDDGTYQTSQSIFSKHLFLNGGLYQVSVEFDTIFGLKAAGRTRVFII